MTTLIMNEIPNRLSIEEGSPYFDPIYRKIGVKLDGKEISNCAEYDIHGRWARVMVRDWRGFWKKERGRFVTITRHNVTVEPFMRAP